MPYFVLVGEILAGAYLLSAVGLLYMKKWGRRLASIIGAVQIAGAMILMTSVLFIIGIIIISFGIAIIWYLWKVRKVFQ